MLVRKTKVILTNLTDDSVFPRTCWALSLVFCDASGEVFESYLEIESKMAHLW